jgi:alkylation response protein AidB-like acyl-CoA dehydrogenase
MNFGLTEEQEVLRTVARRFIDEQAPIAVVRRIMESPQAFDEGVWSSMADLGWPGLTIAEEYGGAGLGWVDLVVLLEETGRGLVPAPLISTALAAAAISEFGSGDQKKRFLPPLANGSAIGTLAVLEESDVLGAAGVSLRGASANGGVRLSGAKHFVQDAGTATLLVVPFRANDTVKLAIVESTAQGVSPKSRRTMDETKSMGDVTFDNVLVAADAVLPSGGEAALSRLLDLAAVAVTAEMVGAMDRDLQITTQYAKDRIQFDQPIGKYQGVKHPLAEMYVEVETSRSLMYYAAWCAAEAPDELPLAAARAKAYASEAFMRIGVDGVQLHGAIGFTAEYDIQLYLKRSKWASFAFGDADYHYERIATLGGY